MHRPCADSSAHPNAWFSLDPLTTIPRAMTAKAQCRWHGARKRRFFIGMENPTLFSVVCLSSWRINCVPEPALLGNVWYLRCKPHLWVTFGAGRAGSEGMSAHTEEWIQGQAIGLGEPEDVNCIWMGDGAIWACGLECARASTDYEGGLNAWLKGRHEPGDMAVLAPLEAFFMCCKSCQLLWSQYSIHCSLCFQHAWSVASQHLYTTQHDVWFMWSSFSCYMW